MSWLEMLAENEKRESGVVGAIVSAAGENETVSPTEPDLSQSGLLYVATDLDSWESSSPEPNQDAICEQGGYRRLDPPYFAWLRHMMVRARQAWERAQLPDQQYELLRTRFNAIQAWAMTRFGEEVLLAAVRALAPGSYRPPAIWEPGEPEAEVAPIHLYPSEGERPHTETVTAEAVSQVDAIRDQALALGWSEAELYQNRGHYQFPVGGEYGLVCFLHSGRKIGEVNTHFIEIVCPGGSCIRHYRSGIAQPWLQTSPENTAK